MTARRVYEGHGVTADIVRHRVQGVPATALALRLPAARRSLSGRGGLKRIRAAANCYLPKEIQEQLGTRPRDWRAYFDEVHRTLFTDDVPPGETVTLATGVDIEHLACRETAADGTWILVLATAGVATNALRTGHDNAAAVPAAGTINIIVATGATLPAGAMAASFVTITEAKTVALLDRGVRSVYDPAVLASGTGTDEVLVVSGDGPRHRYAGGHTRFGSALGRAVRDTVSEALEKAAGHD